MAKKRKEVQMFKLGTAVVGFVAIISLFLNFVVASSSLIGEINAATGFDYITREYGNGKSVDDQIQVYLICFLVLTIIITVVALLASAKLIKLRNKMFGFITTILGLGLVILAILVFTKIDTGSLGSGVLLTVKYDVGVFLHLLAAVGILGMGLFTLVKSK